MTRKCLGGVLLYLQSGMKLNLKSTTSLFDSYFYTRKQSHSSRAHMLGKKIQPMCSQDDKSVLYKCFCLNYDEELSEWKSLSELDVFL